MKAIIKNINSPDVDDLAEYRPKVIDEFGILFEIIAGPVGQEGQESFDLIVCSPKWIARLVSEQQIVIGRHYLIVNEYHYDRILFLRSNVKNAPGKIGRRLPISLAVSENGSLRTTGTSESVQAKRSTRLIKGDKTLRWLLGSGSRKLAYIQLDGQTLVSVTCDTP